MYIPFSRGPDRPHGSRTPPTRPRHCRPSPDDRRSFSPGPSLRQWEVGPRVPTTSDHRRLNTPGRRFSRLERVVKLLSGAMNGKMCHIDRLVQERGNSSELAMELRLSCTNPSILGVIYVLILCTTFITVFKSPTYLHVCPPDVFAIIHTSVDIQFFKQVVDAVHFMGL